MKPIKIILDRELETATQQEIFDYVAAHLLRQNKQAIEGGLCRYRGPEGSKCAFGACISDEAYLDRFEGMKASRVYHCLFKTGLPFCTADFVDSLQLIHDRAAVSEWAIALKSLARSAGLDFDETRLRNAALVS